MHKGSIKPVFKCPNRTCCPCDLRTFYHVQDTSKTCPGHSQLREWKSILRKIWSPFFGNGKEPHPSLQWCHQFCSCQECTCKHNLEGQHICSIYTRMSSYIDKSMSIWINKYMCPGFNSCLRKPGKFGNNNHPLADALSGILYDLKIVGGNDQSLALCPEFDEMGNTVDLLFSWPKSFCALAKLLYLAVVFVSYEVFSSWRMEECLPLPSSRSTITGQNMLMARPSRFTLLTKRLVQ